MTSAAEPRFKITYATLRNDNEQLHAEFEAGLGRARAELGRVHPLYVNGEPRPGDGTFEEHSPIDGSLMGHVREGHARGCPGRDRRGTRRLSRPGAAGRGRSGWPCCAVPPTSSASGRWSSRR